MDEKDEHMFCPQCGQPTTYRSSPEWLLSHWSGLYGGVLAGLIAARRMHRGLSIEEVIKSAYANRGPDVKIPISAKEIVIVKIAQHKEALRDKGWAIEGPMVTGNGYWLVPVEES